MHPVVLQAELHYQNSQTVGSAVEQIFRVVDSNALLNGFPSS